MPELKEKCSTRGAPCGFANPAATLLELRRITSSDWRWFDGQTVKSPVPSSRKSSLTCLSSCSLVSSLETVILFPALSGEEMAARTAVFSPGDGEREKKNTMSSTQRRSPFGNAAAIRLPSAPYREGVPTRRVDADEGASGRGVPPVASGAKLTRVCRARGVSDEEGEEAPCAAMSCG